jgi:hypothetical protein
MFADNRKTILFANNNKSKNIFDVDALAFINLANITSSKEKNAINNLYKNLKGNGTQNSIYNFYTNLTAFYPFAGGKASSFIYNGKNPSASNPYNLTFVGGVSYSTNGAKFNGINGYANTFIPQNLISNSANGMSVYFRENTKRNEIQIGYVNRSTFDATEIGMAWLLNNKAIFGNKSGEQFGANTYTNINGLIRLNRHSGSAYRLYRNGLQIELITATAVTDNNTNTIVIGGQKLSNTNLVGNYSDKTFCYADIMTSSSLSAAQELIYYNCIQQYQTEQGRQV